MRARMILALLGATAAFITAGCMSGRTTTNLVPKSDPALKSPAGMFCINEVNLRYITPNQQPSLDMVSNPSQRILPKLRQECRERYPSLFADESSSTFPLALDITITVTQHPGKTVGWMLGTCLLSSVIFPCPGQTDEAFCVKVGAWGSRDFHIENSFQAEFQRENHGWVSLLTPMALITIPGKSDLPKTKGTIFAINSWEEEYLRQTAQQLATAVAQATASKDAAFWASLPRQRYAEPAVTSFTSVTEGAPTVLQPPGGATSPF